MMGVLRILAAASALALALGGVAYADEASEENESPPAKVAEDTEDEAIEPTEEGAEAAEEEGSEAQQ